MGQAHQSVWGWEGRRPHYSGRLLTVAALSLVGAAAVLAAVSQLFGWPAAALLNVLLLGAAFTWGRRQGARALKSVGAVRIQAKDEPRLRRLTEGLAADLGIAPPTLWLTDSVGANALVCDSRGAALAVSRALLQTYTRTELEAVVAHCLVRIAAGDHLRSVADVLLGPLGRRLGACAASGWDLPAAAVTRYPPALASAIDKAEPQTGRLAPLWFVSEGDERCDPRRRIDALLDL